MHLKQGVWEVGSHKAGGDRERRRHRTNTFNHKHNNSDRQGALLQYLEILSNTF